MTKNGTAAPTNMSLITGISPEDQPLLRVVAIIKDRIETLDKQRNKYRDSKPSQGQEDKPNVYKYEELTQILEFAWDLCKQIMGIAVLSENESKKQARKESAARKNRNVEMVRRVLTVIDTLEQLADPTARSDFLSGTAGATRLDQGDLDALDNIYEAVTPRHLDESGESFYDMSASAARHLVSIVDGSPDEVVGTTYAHIRDVVDGIQNSGYFDVARNPAPAPLEPEAPPAPALPAETLPEERAEEAAFVPPQAGVVPMVAIPPPVPGSVPAPTFPIIPTPVTLQQVEHAYFARQYGHAKPATAPIAEVFGHQNFIFLQDSEIEPAEPVVGTSRSASPAAIPSQTFTNQSFGGPPRHYEAEISGDPRVPAGEMPPAERFPNAPDVRQRVPGFPTAGAPPMALPVHANLPPHIAMQPVHAVAPLRLPNVPSPPFGRELPYEPPNPEIPPRIVDRPAEPEVAENDADYSEWKDANGAEPRRGAERLEIDRWNPADANVDEGGRPGGDRYRQKRRGGGSGGYRGRGGFQNGRGSYGKSDGGHPKTNGEENGDDEDSGHRSGPRKGFFRGKDSGFENRNGGRPNGASQMNGRNRETRGPRPPQAQNGSSKPYYGKKQGNGNRFESRPEGGQQYAQ